MVNRMRYKTERELADALSAELQERKGQFGFSAVYVKDCEMYKAGNPLWGRVQEEQWIRNLRIGCDWRSIVDNLSKRYNAEWREGLMEEVYGGEEGSHGGSRYRRYNAFFETLARDGERFYLITNPYPNTKVLREYIVDGERYATKEELKIIEAYKKRNVHGEDRKQTEMGIPVEAQLGFRCYKLSGLHRLTLGSEVILWDCEYDDRCWLMSAERAVEDCRRYGCDCTELENMLRERKGVLAERTAAGARV